MSIAVSEKPDNLQSSALVWQAVDTGELHTSGVGSGAGYQLPMSKGHHVLPCFAAWDQYYAEPNLYDVWKCLDLSF